MSNIPGFQSVILPYLRELSHGREVPVDEVRRAMADHFSLTPEQRELTHPGGYRTVFGTRVAWAKANLTRAGLILNPFHGRVMISESGQAVLAENPESLSVVYLNRFRESQQETQSEATIVQDGFANEILETSSELIERSHEAIRQATAEELLVRLKGNSPAFFERVVVRLLRAMGYGISGDTSVTGAPHDGGIDGIIREDKLGLDSVCVQAKRWEGTVGRPVVQQFVGSMDVERSRKGVIITTPTFSREAIDYINRIEGKKVVLIDGPRLAELMLEYNVGVLVTKVYEIKDISNDFFDEDEG